MEINMICKPFCLLVFLLLGGTWRTVQSQTRYQNLYGEKDFNTTFGENILGITLGGASFFTEHLEFLAKQQRDTWFLKNTKYDFIVVGAGTAGATIASRLSEIGEFKVLLIEAGLDETLLMDIPALAPLLQSSDDINWKYQGEASNRHCLGMKGHRCNLPRGKVMGGSSVLNFMVATRASPADYDNWAAMGNDGWAYKDVLKYFKKLEDIQIPELRNDTKYHGTGGPVKISYTRFHSILSEGVLEAAQELGYPLVDYNGENMMGFSYMQTTTHNGIRWSSNRAYLVGKQRPNLSVSKNSLVRKVIIDPESRRAIGVEFLKNGRVIKVYAKKEVILSAGAIGSPQILMLSGIGPEEHLKELGIEVIQNARVGDNLMDHIACGGVTWTINEPITFALRTILDLRAPYVKDYFLRKTGPLADISGCDVVGFIDVDDPTNREGPPNVELFYLSGAPYSSEALLDAFGFKQDTKDKFAPLEGMPTYGVYPMLLRPKSRGKIRLRSTDIRVHPKIDLGYLSHPDDVRILIAGVRAALRMGETKAMKKYGSRFYNVSVPGCGDRVYDTDEYWECQLRSQTINIYHQSGTCKMGPATDKTAVVDPKLNVYGVEGLRVVDASIMPEIVSGHTNIPVFMIAEKASDLIKERWGYPTT